MKREQARQILYQNPDFPREIDLLLILIDYCENTISKDTDKSLTQILLDKEKNAMELLHFVVKDAFRSDDLPIMKEILEFAPNYKPEFSMSDLNNAFNIDSSNTIAYALEHNYIKADIKDFLSKKFSNAKTKSKSLKLLESYEFHNQLSQDLADKSHNKRVKI